jgi:SAM-dependent methyltransferase
VLAVEPSAGMRAQRPSYLAPALVATAEALPFDEDAFDAAMAIATIHHWRDPLAGLREMRRVASGPVLVLTFDADALEKYWLVRDYLPEMLADERARMPAIEQIGATLGGVVGVESIPVAADCRDGFLEAYYGRPEAYLQQEVRAAQSVWPRLREGVERRALRALEADLASGAWDERNGHLRSMRAYDGSLRLITSLPR